MVICEALGALGWSALFSGLCTLCMLSLSFHRVPERDCMCIKGSLQTHSISVELIKTTTNATKWRQLLSVCFLAITEIIIPVKLVHTGY